MRPDEPSENLAEKRKEPACGAAERSGEGASTALVAMIKKRQMGENRIREQHSEKAGEPDGSSLAE
jgi:hypothetical protein